MSRSIHIYVHDHRRPRTRAADAPVSVTHRGKTFHATGKTGTHRASGEQAHEYEEIGPDGEATGARVWRRSSGAVYEDSARDAAAIGSFVVFMAPSLHGKQKLRGKVVAIKPDGKIEVRVAEGGYHQIEPSEIIG